MTRVSYMQVVDNVVDDVPDAAPEIDATVGSASDIAAALINMAGAPSGGDIYLRVSWLALDRSWP